MLRVLVTDLLEATEMFVVHTICHSRHTNCFEEDSSAVCANSVCAN